MRIYMDESVDAVAIEFEEGEAGYAEKVDDNRIVDYSANPGRPIGVSLHGVSKGVRLEGLPQPEQVKTILERLGVTVL
jgi:hypothetical protein